MRNFVRARRAVSGSDSGGGMRADTRYTTYKLSSCHILDTAVTARARTQMPSRLGCLHYPGRLLVTYAST